VSVIYFTRRVTDTKLSRCEAVGGRKVPEGWTGRCEAGPPERVETENRRIAGGPAKPVTVESACLQDAPVAGAGFDRRAPPLIIFIFEKNNCYSIDSYLVSAILIA